MRRHGSLNRVYRVVFNQAKGAWHAVAEIGEIAGKSSSASRKKSGLVKTLSVLARQLTLKALIGSLFLVSTSALAAKRMFISSQHHSGCYSFEAKSKRSLLSGYPPNKTLLKYTRCT